MFPWLAYLTSVSLPIRIQDHALVTVVSARVSRRMCFFQVLIGSSWPTTWILPRIRNQVKTAINVSFFFCA